MYGLARQGMACALLIALFQLAPSASHFEPNLFSYFLALVMALYIRAGLTDIMAQAEKVGDNRKVDWAVSLWSSHLSNAFVAATSYTRVVWMVVMESRTSRRLSKNHTMGQR
jgi:hypothetical protein